MKRKTKLWMLLLLSIIYVVFRIYRIYPQSLVTNNSNGASFSLPDWQALMKHKTFIASCLNFLAETVLIYFTILFMEYGKRKTAVFLSCICIILFLIVPCYVSYLDSYKANIPRIIHFFIIRLNYIFLLIYILLSRKYNNFILLFIGSMIASLRFFLGYGGIIDTVFSVVTVIIMYWPSDRMPRTKIVYSSGYEYLDAYKQKMRENSHV